jgi:hypothetical protein
MNISISHLGEVVVSWIIYLIFIQQATDTLGVRALYNIITGFVNFVPNVIGAFTIMLLAYIFGNYLKDSIIGDKMMHLKILGNIIFFLVIYIGITISLPMVGIQTQLISQLLLLVVGGLALGLAIAIGFGVKDVIAKNVEEFIKDYKPKQEEIEDKKNKKKK